MAQTTLHVRMDEDMKKMFDEDFYKSKTISTTKEKEFGKKAFESAVKKKMVKVYKNKPLFF